MRAKAHHVYAIALGSNKPRSRKLTPRKLVAKAIKRFSRKPFDILGASRIIETPPLGPSRRRYANAAVLVKTKLAPPALLETLHQMEHKAGRNRNMRRWAARPLDLDILLWSGGLWADGRLVIPHPEIRKRDFVLAPLVQVAAEWRDPLSGLTARQLLARLHKARKKCARKSGKSG